jgi:hypothetical protein
MSKSKRKYAKVGDRVKIITPKLFQRCGYPLDPFVVREKFKDEITKRATEALQGMLGIPIKAPEQANDLNELFGVSEIVSEYRRPYAHLEKAVISYILQRERFGGRNREIHEVEVSGIANRIAIIDEVNYVKTGTYTPASQCGYYSDDYDPPCLDEAKVHAIYSITIVRDTASIEPDFESIVEWEIMEEWESATRYSRNGVTRIRADYVEILPAETELAVTANA